MQSARVRVLRSGGLVRVRAETAEHVVEFEIEEASVTSLLFRASDGWSEEFRGRLLIGQPFRLEAASGG